MCSSSDQDRTVIITNDSDSFKHSFAQDIDKGLKNKPKNIPCLYFYDYQGSLLFEKICKLPEYYLTRIETGLLKTYSKQIISDLPSEFMLVELGSGSSTKTQFIIEELVDRNQKVVYCAIDISQKMLKESTQSLLEKYQDLEVVLIAAEYGEGIRQLELHREQPKLILWLGSSIGNFDLDEAVRFLRDIVKRLSTRDFILIGFDLEKDRTVLENAYNDSLNVTSEFNLNLLTRINQELGGEFDLRNFVHQAIYNEGKGRIEMYLVSTCQQSVYVADLNETYHFDKDERIHTENAYKYSLQDIASIADQAGMKIVKQWTDSDRYFNLTLFKPEKP